MRRRRVFSESEDIKMVYLYQPTVCERKTTADCVLRIALSKIDDPIRWKAKAETCAACKFKGIPLSQQQYNTRKEGVIV